MGLISPQVPEFPQKQFDILHPIGSILAPVVYACLFHNTAYDHEGIFCEIKKKNHSQNLTYDNNMQFISKK